MIVFHSIWEEMDIYFPERLACFFAMAKEKVFGSFEKITKYDGSLDTQK